MSGESYTGICPQCGRSMECYSDWKPHDTVGGYCLDCGFEYSTVEGQMTLEEVNTLRADEGLKPLDKLAELLPEKKRKEK